MPLKLNNNLKLASFLVPFIFYFSALPVLFIPLLGVTLLIIIFTSRWDFQFEKTALEKEDYFLLAFFIFILASGFLAKDPGASYRGAAVFLLYIIIYYLFKNMDFGPGRYSAITKAAAVSLLLICAFALVHYFIIRNPIIFYFNDHLIFRLRSYNNWFEERPLVSIFGHPAIGGNLISFLLIFILSFLFIQFRKLSVTERAFYIVSSCIASATMVLTFTRGAIIDLGIVFIFCVLFTKKYKLLLFLIIVGALLFFIPSEKIRDTIKNPFSSPNAQTRISQYKAGLDFFGKNNKITGMGLLNFAPQYKKDYTGTANFEKVPYIHNSYLAILVETGIIGFILLFGFFGVSLFSLIRSNRKNWAPAALNGTIFIIAFMASSLFDSILYVVPIGAFLWIALGLSRNKSIE
jgi:O-antigen ligase